MHNKKGFFQQTAILAALGILIALPLSAGDADELPPVAPGVRAPRDTLFHEPLSRGIHVVYQDRFEEGIAIFDSLQAAYPDHPGPYFYRAAAYQTWMSSYRFNRYQGELERDVSMAIEKGEGLLSERPHDPWLNFYIGAALGYRAFFKMRSWNFIGAYRDGTRGIGNFREALEKQKITVTAATIEHLRGAGADARMLDGLERMKGHPLLGREKFMDTLRNLIGKNEQKRYGALIYQHTDSDIPLYDVYLGLGSYHYWRTARSKFVRIIAFWMSDKRDLGLAQIKFAIDHGRYSPAEATLVLITALIDYQRPDEALTVLDEFMLEPANRTLSALYLRGRIMLQKERWQEVYDLFDEIHQRLDGKAYSATGYKIECRYRMAAALAALGKSAAARELAGAGLALAEQRDEQTELEGQFDSFDDIHKALKKLYESLN